MLSLMRELQGLTPEDYVHLGAARPTEPCQGNQSRSSMSSNIDGEEAK